MSRSQSATLMRRDLQLVLAAAQIGMETMNEQVLHSKTRQAVENMAWMFKLELSEQLMNGADNTKRHSQTLPRRLR